MKKIRVCFDFDGYLCRYSGWRGHDKIGKPIILHVGFVKELYDLGVELVLSTTRLNPFPFGEGLMDEADEVVVSGEAKEHIIAWLQEQGILHCFKEITGYKPYADIYLDDRGWAPSWSELVLRIDGIKEGGVL